VPVLWMPVRIRDMGLNYELPLNEINAFSDLLISTTHS
jgi:hypothetical protein